MKKNVLMRAASGLLVATMLTTCAISGTFAKYVTQDNGGDVARVAKWGVTLQVEGDLYSQKYLNGSNTATDADGATIGVDGKQNIGTQLQVVAPGTKNDGNGFYFGINGKPEVDSKTKVTITTQNIFLGEGRYGVMVPVADGVLTEENYEEIVAKGELYTGTVGGTYTLVTTGSAPDATLSYFTLEDEVNVAAKYWPVVYKMTGNAEGTTVTSNDTEDSLAKIAEQIFEQINKDDTANLVEDTQNVKTATVESGIIENNLELAQDVFKLGGELITWEWNFTDATPDAQWDISQKDKQDTILGNLMAQRQDADFHGEVVKYDTTNANFKAPTEHTDYCLDTQFNIDITVAQVD